MGLFKKKEKIILSELKCPVKGCLFTCDDPITMKKHLGWAHPGLLQDNKKKD